MRQRARVDVNQKAVVTELRQLGCFVEPALSRLGGGVPDLLVGFRGRWILVELKNPDMPPSKQRLTQDEERWHEAVGDRGPVIVATAAEEVMFEFVELEMLRRLTTEEE